MKTKPDPCARPFYRPSVLDDYRVRVWNPSRDRIDILHSDIFPKLDPGDYAVFMMGLLIGNEVIESFSFGVN